MRPLGRRPGIHNPQWWLWIPGSPPSPRASRGSLATPRNDVDLFAHAVFLHAVFRHRVLRHAVFRHAVLGHAVLRHALAVLHAILAHLVLAHGVGGLSGCRDDGQRCDDRDDQNRCSHWKAPVGFAGTTGTLRSSLPKLYARAPTIFFRSGVTIVETGIYSPACSLRCNGGNSSAPFALTIRGVSAGASLLLKSSSSIRPARFSILSAEIKICRTSSLAWP